MNKIVYVEDDPDVGALIAAYLGKHDMDVIVEPRGDNAEATIAREKPDLVLLDIMLPGKDGMTLCRDLRCALFGMQSEARGEMEGAAAAKLALNPDASAQGPCQAPRN